VRGSCGKYHNEGGGMCVCRLNASGSMWVHLASFCEDGDVCSNSINMDFFISWATQREHSVIKKVFV
jgi:hypothetical protein